MECTLGKIVFYTESLRTGGLWIRAQPPLPDFRCNTTSILFYLHSQLNGIAQEGEKRKLTTKNIIKSRISPI